MSRVAREEHRGDIPLFGASGIIDYVDFATHSGKRLLVSEDGTNLRSRRTAIALPADGEFSANNHIHVLEPVGQVDLEFAALVINSTDVSHLLSGIAQPKLGQARLRTLPVPVPPPEEQKLILDRWTQFMSTAQLAVDSAESALYALKLGSQQQQASILDDKCNEEPTRPLKDWLTGIPELRSVAALHFEEAWKQVSASLQGNDSKSTLDEVVRSRGQVSVDDLFTATGRSVSEIEAFYVELRDLIRRGIVRIDASGALNAEPSR